MYARLDKTSARSTAVTYRAIAEYHINNLYENHIQQIQIFSSVSSIHMERIKKKQEREWPNMMKWNESMFKKKKL